VSVPLTEEGDVGLSAPAVHDPCRTRDSKGFGDCRALREAGCVKAADGWLCTGHALGHVPLRGQFHQGLLRRKRNIRGQGLGYQLMAEKVAHMLAEAWNLQRKRSSCVSSVEARHPARDARSAWR
jgi:hypothetical protein